MSTENATPLRGNGPRVAFEVEINDMRCIVFAETPAKARWVAYKGYREAGYGRPGTWPSCKTKRVPRLDNSRLRNEPKKAYAPEYVEGT